MYYFHFIKIFMLNRLLGLGEPDEGKIAQFKDELSTKLDVYERILSKQPYIAGQVSYKIYCLIPCISYFEIWYRHIHWPIYFICLLLHYFSKWAKVI